LSYFRFIKIVHVFSNQETAWDEVRSDKPPPIPVKPAIYTSQPLKQNNGDVSLAMRLREVVLWRLNVMVLVVIELIAVIRISRFLKFKGAKEIR